MARKIDYIRHEGVFNPLDFNDRVDVIGAGSTGSRVVLSLAKLGIKNIHVWDFDKVEAHNIPNQVYGVGDVGKYKVDALAEIVQNTAGISIEAHRDKVEGPEVSESNIVFLLTDTMESRKEIWDNGIKMKYNIRLMVETRMGADSGRIYVVNPISPTEISQWEDTLCEDEVAEDGCGASTSVGPTADILAGMAVWQFMRWNSNRMNPSKDEDPVDSEVMYSVRPMMMMGRKFKQF